MENPVIFCCSRLWCEYHEVPQPTLRRSTYVALDIIRRVVERQLHATGESLSYALGITDIDDKIIQRATERGISAHELAAESERAFLADMAALGVAPATQLLRVTEHVDAIIDMVARIIAAGFAYESPSGVYFDTTEWGTRYGKLAPPEMVGAPRSADSSCLDVTNPGWRVDDQSADKRDRRDFALWKRRRPYDGGGTAASSPVWESPWGAGRPGWHIECSAMCVATFGHTLDVHAGGVDLAFPHHCNEIAQVEAAAAVSSPIAEPTLSTPAARELTSSRWCGTWLHTGHLHIEGRKMSKSLKNFVPVASTLSSIGGGMEAADAFRMFVAAQRYRAPATYSDTGLQEARVRAARTSGLVLEIAMAARDAQHRQRTSLSPRDTACERWSDTDHALAADLEATRVAVAKALNNDFDTPAVLRLLGGFTRRIQVATATIPHRRQPVGIIRAAAAFLAEEYATLGFSFGSSARRVLDDTGTRIVQGAPTDAGPVELRVGMEAADASAPRAAAQVTGTEDAVAVLMALRNDARTAAKALTDAVRRTQASSLSKSVLPDAGAAPLPQDGEPTSAREAALRELADAAAKAATALHRACDRVRDTDMPRLGMSLKDTSQGPVVIAAGAASKMLKPAQ